MNSALNIFGALHRIKTFLSFFIRNNHLLNLDDLLKFSRLFINNRLEIKAMWALEIKNFLKCFTEKKANADGFFIIFPKLSLDKNES